MAVIVRLTHKEKSAHVNLIEEEARTLTDLAFGAIKGTAEKLLGGLALIRMTYKDDEGDNCTLSAATILDALSFCKREGEFALLELSVKGDEPEAEDVSKPPANFAVHRGIECDVSGMCPIVGPRYNKIGHDYDLCEEEFLKLPEEAKAAFRKIDHPENHVQKASEVLKTRHGWSDATMEVVKTSSLIELLESMQDKMSPDDFAKLAATIEPIYAVDESYLLPCIEELHARLMNMLDWAGADALLQLIPSCVEGVISSAVEEARKPQPKLAVPRIEETPADGRMAYGAVLTQLLQHSDGAVRAAARDALMQALPSPCAEVATDKTQKLLDSIAGRYECCHYDDDAKNDWHFVDLKLSEEDPCAVTWSNRAGVSWTLKAFKDEAQSLSVLSDCPYWTEGHHVCDVKLAADGRVDAVQGPWGELYRRVIEASQQDAKDEKPAEEVPPPVPAASAKHSELVLPPGSAIFEDAALRGDATEEFKELLGHYHHVTQAHRLGCIAVPKDAAGEPIVAKVYITNTGSAPWADASSLCAVAGPAHGYGKMALGAVPAGETIEIVMDLVLAKGEPGSASRSAWAMCDAGGEPFGPLLVFETVYI